MSKSKQPRKAGVHLFKDHEYAIGRANPVSYWFWHLVASNGRVHTAMLDVITDVRQRALNRTN